jgi:signal transduction histidine kinase
MNRLWVYLSITFTTVIILAVLGIMVATRVGVQLAPNTPQTPPPEVAAYIREQALQRITPDATIVIIIIGIVAIGAGVWMSRRLTKPLSELESAAIAIGQQNLSSRVPVHGSQEFVAVATAFNKMAALLEKEESLRRNLLADVAHELRHPVHIIQGNLQAILDGVYPLTDDEIARIMEQINHLSVMVNDLHLLALAEAHQLPLIKEDTDIAVLIKEQAASFTSLAEARAVTVRVQLLGTMPENMQLDADRMRQAINNLLDNALRHTADGGLIQVILERQGPDLVISIVDNGEGISAAELPYVFDRFYRVDKARERLSSRSGLGLAIVKAIIEAHNGTITAASPGLGQGSTFTIKLEV